MPPAVPSFPANPFPSGPLGLSTPPLLIDPLFWRGRLDSCAADFRAEAVRLRQLVRDPGVTGPAARSVAGCALRLSGELTLLAEAAQARAIQGWPR